MNKNEIKGNIINIIDINDNNKGGNININIPNNQLNQMTIVYIIDKNLYLYSFKIFGSVFVRNNKNNCYFIMNGQQRELCDSLNWNEINTENNQLKIKLIENKYITDMSYMFNDCPLFSLPDISNWNTANVTNMSHIFL